MADSAPESATVPVKVPEPAEHAPPTLAEPASGPAAEMSGALAAEQSTVEAPKPAEAESATVNGTVEPAVEAAKDQSAETAEKPTSEAPAAIEDSEMKDAPEPAPKAQPEEPASEANGTAAEKKAANGKRKSASGVPEHSKTKKLGKKKSMQKITHLDAQPGDYFFARLKSYPPWPSIICDEDMLPSSLLNTRPVTTKKADGTYNEAYADGGKKVADRTFPIMFLHTNEFAWIPNTDLAPLNPEECKEVSEKGKAKSLLAAYAVAAEHHGLQYFKDMLMDHARALEEDEAMKEARAAEKAAKSDKKKQKSEAKTEKDEDVHMVDGDAEAAPKKSSKKRKKEAESGDDETEKPAKTPKTTKLKLTTNKTPATSEKKAKEPKAAKAKSEKRKSKAAVSDEEMPDAEEREEEEPLDPVEARKAREKEVLFLRHRLQKGFLTRDQAPQEEEMPQMATYIKKLEGYGDKLEVSIIRNTKINKVLKALIKLNTIPKDEEHQFRKRSVDLLGVWNKLLGAEPADSEKFEKEDKASPATNGVHRDAEEKAEERIEQEVEEPKEKVAEPAEATDKVSSEVDTDPEAKASVVETLEQEAEKPAYPESEKIEEPKKDEAPAPEATEKAPESAEAAAEATDVVKTTE